jgi:hypothetical protein
MPQTSSEHFWIIQIKIDANTKLSWCH